MADLSDDELDLVFKSTGDGYDVVVDWVTRLATEVHRYRAATRPILTSHSEDAKQVRHTLDTIRPVYATTVSIIERWLEQRAASKEQIRTVVREGLDEAASGGSFTHRLDQRLDAIAVRVAEQLAGVGLNRHRSDVAADKERMRTVVRDEMLCLITTDGPITTPEEVETIATRVAEQLAAACREPTPRVLNATDRAAIVDVRQAVQCTAMACNDKRPYIPQLAALDRLLASQPSPADAPSDRIAELEGHLRSAAEIMTEAGLDIEATDMLEAAGLDAKESQ